MEGTLEIAFTLKGDEYVEATSKRVLTQIEKLCRENDLKLLSWKASSELKTTK